MREFRFSSKLICREVHSIIGTKFNDGWHKRSGRPREFCDVFIISFFLWQTLNGLSYLEILAETKKEFGISPFLLIYHSCLKKLIPKYFKELQGKSAEKFFGENSEKLNLFFMEQGLVSTKCIHLNSTWE